MRNDIFDYEDMSEELLEYIDDNSFIEENKNLSEDYHTLRKNYSIILDYMRDLEAKIRMYKRENDDLHKKIKHLRKNKKDDIDLNAGVNAYNKERIKNLNYKLGSAKSRIKVLERDNKDLQILLNESLYDYINFKKIKDSKKELLEILEKIGD